MSATRRSSWPRSAKLRLKRITPATAGDSSHSRSSASIDVLFRSIISGPSDTSPSLQESCDVDHGADGDAVEQLHDLFVAHSNAADRARHAHRLGIRRAVNVDVAAHRVDLAETIAADLRARQPQDTRQDPVAAGVRRGKLGRPDLAGRPAAAKD